MQWKCKTFDQLTNKEIWNIYDIRAQTFIVAQNRLYNDIDEIDLNAYHVLGYINNRLVAYARFYRSNKQLSFGRVLTIPEVRGKGIGNQLMNYLLKQINLIYPNENIEITAQADKSRFYKKFGFQTQGNVFIHAQTPHITMIKEIKRDK